MFRSSASCGAGSAARALQRGLQRLHSADRYSYVNGDPVNLVDPNGHKSCANDIGPCGEWSYKGQTGCDGCNGGVQAFQQQYARDKYVLSPCGGSWDVRRVSLHGRSTCEAMRSANWNLGQCERSHSVKECTDQTRGQFESAFKYQPTDCFAERDGYDPFCESMRHQPAKPSELGVPISFGIGVADPVIGAQVLLQTLGNPPKKDTPVVIGALTDVGEGNAEALREWAKSNGWVQKEGGGPEAWGEYNDKGEFEWRLKIKAEPSTRPGLGPDSGVPRFDARLNSSGDYINPFTGEMGGKDIGTHLPLEEGW